MEETTWKSFRIWGFADPYKYTAQLITPTSIRCSSLSLARSASSDGQFLSFFSAAPHHRLIGCRTGLGSYGAAQTNGRYVSCRQSCRPLWYDGSGSGNRSGSHPQRGHATFVGMGIRPSRPREHHVHRLQPGGGRGFRPLATDESARLVHRAFGLVFLCLERNLFATTFTGDLFEKKWANTNYGLVYPPKDWVRSWPVPVLPGCLKRPVPGRGHSMP